MRPLIDLGRVVGLCALVSACGPTSSTDPTVAPAAPVASVATVAPTATAAKPTTVPTTPASKPAPTLASAGTVTLVVDPAATTASYHAHEQLVGNTLPSEAVGRSTGVSGSIVLLPDGSIAADRSQISVDVSKLSSDQSRRDNFMKSNTLQVSRYPMATFVPREAGGLPTPLPTSGQATFQLMGDLTVHGVTKSVTWQVAAQFAEASVSGDATTNVNISDFGMTPPKAGPVLSIEDALGLELAFSATRS